ncbi:MAG: DUF1573 domain-containing protein [Phycisphaerales bacterium]
MSVASRRRSFWLALVAAFVVVGGSADVATAQVVGGRAVDGSQAQPAPARGRAAPRLPQAVADPNAPGVNKPDQPLRLDFPLPLQGEAPKLNWGVVPMTSVLYGSVNLINRSDEPLTIAAMRPSCQCTALNDLSGTVIAPGESAEVVLSVETKNIPGTSTNRVRFVFTDGTVTQVDLIFRTTWAILAEPTYIDALTNPYGVIRLQSIDGEPFRILATNGHTPIYADGYDPSTPPRNEYLIVWNVSTYDGETCLDADGKHMPMWWVVETDHEGAPLIDLRVRQLPCTQLDLPGATRRWYLSQNHLPLGLVDRGSEHDFELELKWLPNSVINDSIGRISEESDEFDITMTEVIRDGDRIVVRGKVRITDQASDLVYSNAIFHGEDPRNTQRLAIIATVNGGARAAGSD